MARPKGSRNKGMKKRLAPTEQVISRHKSTAFGGGKSYYEEYDTLSVSQIRDLMIRSVWIDVCANIIADEVVKNRLKTTPEDKKIDAFLELPSETEPLFLIRKKYIKDMLRYGNGGCAIEYKNGKPSRLTTPPGYAIRVTDKEPPTYIFLDIDRLSQFKTLKGADGKPVTDDKGKVKLIELTLKEFMHFAIEKDSDRTLARSPLQKAYNLILSDKNIGMELAKFTSRGFYKPSFISLASGGKTDVEDFVEWLNNMIGEGMKVCGINKKAELKEIPFWSAKEITDTMKTLGLIIANVYKVPPFMLNLVEDTGSLNAREQKSRFIENAVLPILEYEAYLYTMTLVRKGFKNTKSKITSPLLATRLTYDKARTARLLVGEGVSIFTPNEARDIFFGMKEIDKTQLPAAEVEPKKE